MEKNSGNGNVEVYELAICFARMWGVAETLSPLPNLSFPEVKERMIQWAMEFIEGREEDILMFFRRKLAQAERVREEEREGGGERSTVIEETGGI